jgi:hypothetical protein
MDDPVDTRDAAGAQACAWCDTPVLTAFAAEARLPAWEADRVYRFHETCLIAAEVSARPPDRSSFDM